MAKGGARAGAGRPSGKKYKCITLTLDEEAVEILEFMEKEKRMTISQFITDHFRLPYYKNLPSKNELEELNNMPDEDPGEYKVD